MALDADVFEHLTKAAPPDAWQTIVRKALEITARTITLTNPASEVMKRDREIATLDHFLSSSGWDLWQAFDDAVEKTSNRLAAWWAQPYNAKAVLLLDGLSLREAPWLLKGAEDRGLTIHSSTATASEIPGETDPFAHALGFASRSQLQNNGAGRAHKLVPARTECVNLSWRDCAALIDGTPNWVFWHQWPDSKIHDGAGAGQGLDVLTRSVAEQLSSDDFWNFIERLATGRRLIITSDHGYAATGLFYDASGEQAALLKTTFKSGRNIAGSVDAGPFVPPVALQIDNVHGAHLITIGRWKWRSQGGYPTLAHGGLSLLEVLSPFIELTK